MEIGVVVELVQQIVAVRADTAAGRESVEEGLRSVGRLQAWLSASRTALTAQLASHAMFPEQAAADCTRLVENSRGRCVHQENFCAKSIGRGPHRARRAAAKPRSTTSDPSVTMGRSCP